MQGAAGAGGMGLGGKARRGIGQGDKGQGQEPEGYGWPGGKDMEQGTGCKGKDKGAGDRGLEAGNMSLELGPCGPESGDRGLGAWGWLINDFSNTDLATEVVLEELAWLASVILGTIKRISALD